MYGYAFALRSRLCEETAAPWSELLRPDARAPFEAGWKFLKKQRPVVWDELRDSFRTFGDPPTIDNVIRQLRHRDAAVQVNALDDVAEFKLNEEPVYHEINHLVHDPVDEVREETIRTISLLDADSDQLSEALTFFCDDSTPRIRNLAALALGSVRHPPAEAVNLLRELARDPESIVASAAAESLLSFPEGLSDDRPLVFRVLRQQLARCNYAGVDRFMRRLQRSATDVAALIEGEFSTAEEASWRQILLQSVEAVGSGEPE
jgi:hypothetical protein